MDISNLFSNYASTFGSGKSSNGPVITPGTTWGPAVTRLTHTPISFTTNSLDAANAVGQFDPAKGSITVNPTINDPSETIRHESIHALLNQLPPGQESNISASAPNYGSIANVLGRQVGGNTVQEVPAYMASSPTSKFLGVSNADRDQYVDHIQKVLMQLHPTLGTTLQRLIQSGQK